MIEVFKTNIRRVSEARKLINMLLQHIPGSKINVDLHDCDKILRVEASYFVPAAVMQLVTENGYHCIVLND